MRSKAYDDVGVPGAGARVVVAVDELEDGGAGLM